MLIINHLSLITGFKDHTFMLWDAFISHKLLNLKKYKKNQMFLLTMTSQYWLLFQQSRCNYAIL